MKRKVIKQGHNTLTITLPNKWVKELGIEAGDELDVIENNGTVTVHGTQHSAHKVATIDINNLKIPMIWRFFQSAYREGYDEIKIIYNQDQKAYDGAYSYYLSQFEYTKMGEKPIKKPALEVIQELVNRFIGIAIMDNKEGCCTIKEMGILTSKEFDNSLRRIFLLILELFDHTIELIKKNKIGDIGVCKTIHEMDTNIDRFIDYCCRITNKINDSSFQKNKQAMFSTLFLLELLGDEFKYIGAHLAKSKKSISELDSFSEQVKEHFEMYYHLFYKFDKEAVRKFGENDFNIYNEHFKWKESKNEDAKSIRRHLMQISKFTFCLTELRIEMEF